MTNAVTTRLDAVNEMLGSVSENPVATLDDNGSADVVMALQVLDETQRKVLVKGWDCNIEVMNLVADSYGIVNLPDTILSFEVLDRRIDAVRRGARLYDRNNRTFTFEPGKTIAVEAVLWVDFDDLPESARQYIAVRAARVFHGRAAGDREGRVASAEDEREAYMTFRADNKRQNRANLLGTSLTTLGVTNRRSLAFR